MDRMTECMDALARALDALHPAQLSHLLKSDVESRMEDMFKRSARVNVAFRDMDTVYCAWLQDSPSSSRAKAVQAMFAKSERLMNDVRAVHKSTEETLHAFCRFGNCCTSEKCKRYGHGGRTLVERRSLNTERIKQSKHEA